MSFPAKAKRPLTAYCSSTSLEGSHISGVRSPTTKRESIEGRLLLIEVRLLINNILRHLLLYISS